jgi:hypothetical protein
VPLEGARDGAPGAIQVADRWHIWDNLARYVEKTVAVHHRCLQPPEPEQQPAAVADDQPDPQLIAAQAAADRAENSAIVVRTRQRYEQVQALKAQGMGIKPILRELGLAKETVRRFYRADSVEDLRPTPWPGARPSWTSSSHTCTSGGTMAAPTSWTCTRISPPWATAEATALFVTTWPRSGSARRRRP